MMETHVLKTLTMVAVLLGGHVQLPADGLGQESFRKAIPLQSREAQIVRELGPWLSQRAEKDGFTGAVLLGKGDEILFQSAHGFADGATKTPNRPESQFYLASVTKVFTAVAILQLAQAGKLSLDDKLANVLPEYPNKETAGKITVRQLLTHSSGLGNFFEKFAQLSFQQYQTLESLLPVFADEPLQFEPGTKTFYSNAGYVVLGLIITRHSGQSFEEYLQKQIFEPAGMTNSGCSTAETRALNCIGGARSTVQDLFRFSQALQKRRLLNQQFTDLALTGAAGMAVDTVNGFRIVGQVGGAPGMSTSFEVYTQV